MWRKKSRLNDFRNNIVKPGEKKSDVEKILK